MKKTKDICHLQTLTELLKENLPHVHRARLTAIAIFALSLISEATVNLRKLTLSGITTVKADSVHKRLSRLLVLKLTNTLKGNHLILCMDRTNWKYGKSQINYLVVSLRINTVGYPIA